MPYGGGNPHYAAGGGGGWRPTGPAMPAGMPSYMREQYESGAFSELQQTLDEWGDDSSDEERHENDLHNLPDVSRSHEVLTLTVLKMGKLGMRITDSDQKEVRGYAIVDGVSDGPAKAAGIQGDDLIISINGERVVGRAEATAMLQKAAGLLTLQIARRKGSTAARGGGGGAAAGGQEAFFGYVGVD